MKIFIDSFSWIELFRGTSKGERVKRLLKENEGEAYASTANYYEVYYRLTQDLGEEKRIEYIAFMKSNVVFVDVTEEVAVIAGEIRLKHGLSAVDAFTLASARLVKAKFVTGDEDFKKFEEEVIFI